LDLGPIRIPATNVSGRTQSLSDKPSRSDRSHAGQKPAVIVPNTRSPTSWARARHRGSRRQPLVPEKPGAVVEAAGCAGSRASKTTGRT
jgi:hypothetical protein